MKSILTIFNQEKALSKIALALGGVVTAVMFGLFVFPNVADALVGGSGPCCGEWNDWIIWNPEPVINPWGGGGFGGGGGGGGGTPTPVAPSCVSFTSSPSSINEGDSATLSWLVAGNPTSISISPSVGTVSTFNGSTTVSPTVTTTYTMTVSNSVGSATCQTTVSVNPPTTPAPTCVLTANPSVIVKGNTSTLSWQVTNASSATLTGFGNLSLSSANASGTKTVSPSSTSSYTLSVLGTNGNTITCTAGVLVTLPPAPVCTLTADKLVLEQGETTTLRWTISNATEAYLQHLDAVSIITPAHGTQTTGAIGMYTLSVSDGYGRTDVCEVELERKPTPPEPLACEIIVNPQTIQKGDSASITWSSTNATNCVATNFSTNGSLNGTGTVSPDKTTTYSMTCTRPGTGGTGTWQKTYTDTTDLWCPRSIHHNISTTLSTVYQGIPDCPSNVSSASCDTIGSACKVNTWNQNTCRVKTEMYSCNAPSAGSTPYTPPTSVTCTAKVTVTEPPEAPGCIRVLKETFDTNGSKLDTVAQFTFKLDGGVATAQNDADGKALFTNVTPGVHTVTEVLPESNWKMLSVTPANGQVTVQSGPNCAAVVFKNQQVVEKPPAPKCDFFTADPTSITSGGSSKLEWGTTNATSVSINQGIGSVAVDGSKTVSPTSDTTYTLTATGPGGTATCTRKVTVGSQPPAPVCTLTADKLVLEQGETTTLRWTISNATEAYLQHLDAVSIITPAHGTQTTGAIGLYTLSVSDGYGRTDVCTVELKRSAGPGPACTLSINKSSITTGESATLSWTSSNATFGFIDNNVGTTSPVSSGSVTIFPPESKTYTGVFTGPLGTTTCSAAIAVNKGPGGCTGNCGGGLNPPNVVLFQKPGDQLLAFVSLSQIPYTGFEAGPVLTFFFWLAVAIWSVGLTYLFFGKGGMRFVAQRVFASAAFNNQRYEEYDYSDSETVSTESNEYVYAPSPTYDAPQPEASTPVNASTVFASSVPATTTMQIPSATTVAPEPKAPANDGVPELKDVIESRAHAAGVLLSPEATVLATQLSPDRAETLKKFGDILNRAVQTIPREDGWILLSSDRMNEIAKTVAPSATKESPVVQSTPQTHTASPQLATVEALADSTPTALVRAIFSQDRDTAYALIREYEKEGISPTKLMTGTATMLDGLFCARRDQLTVGDLSLHELSASVPDDTLATLVEIFTHALDARYASPYTGVKLAVAQAFDEIS